MDYIEIIELMQKKKYVQARKEVLNLNSVHIAELLETLDKNNALILFRMLPKDVVVNVFAYLPNEQQIEIINAITDREIKHIMDELYFDDMIDFLEEMPANLVKKILKNTKEEERILINQFLNYPENSAGSLMTIEYVDLKKEMTVKQAMDHIKKVGVDRETIYSCYVTDLNRKLEGIVSLRKLVITDEDKTMEEIMNTDVIRVNTHEDQEAIASLFKKYDLIVVPVVDKEQRLTGIITIDDIVDVIDKENTEDFHKMAAMAPSEEKYLETSVITLAKHRIIWLLVLMLSATLTGGIIEKYEKVLESVVILTAFMPMLMNTGGNAGSQSSTLIIRGLALGDIRLRDILKVIWKEARVGTLVGIMLTSVNFLRIYVLKNIELRICITVSITLFLTVVLAKVVGGTLPIIARKFKLDPAIMASPLITTIVDAVTLSIYFSLSVLLLGL